MPKPRSTSPPIRFSGDEEEDPDLQMNLDTALALANTAQTVYPVPDESNNVSNNDVLSDSDQDQADQDQADHDYHESLASQPILHTSTQSSVSLLGALGARTPRSTSTPSRSSHSHSRSHSRTDDDSSASILDSGSGLSGPRAKKPKQRSFFIFDRNNSVASCDNDEDLNEDLNDTNEMVPQPTAADLVSAKETEEEVTAQIKKKYDHLLKHGFWKVVSAKRNPTEKRRSKVDIKFACMMCSNCILACSSDSIGNLLTHVRTKHPKRETDYIKLKSKNQPLLEWGNNMTQPRIDQLDLLKKNRGGNNRNPLTVTQKQLDDAIVNYMVKDGQAFNMVNGAGFRDFVRTLCPGRKIMSRWTATRRVREDFDRLKKRMIDMFKTVDNVAISVDGWSKNTKGFMGYTVTWIDEDLERTTLALACKRLEGAHTWKVLADHIENTLRAFNINHKTTMCTTDGASNFKKAFEKYGEDSLALKAYTEDIPGTQVVGDDEQEEEQEDEFGNLLEGYLEDVNEAEGQDDDDEGGINAINLGDEFDKAESAGELDGTKLPYRIRCASHNLNLVACKDAAEPEKNTKYNKENMKYATVKKKFMEKVEFLWSRQGTSTHDAEAIVRHVGCRLKRPNKTRWNAYYDSLKFLKKKIDAKDDKLRGLLDELGQKRFSGEELLFLDEWLKLQEPIAEALDTLQGDVGLGYALPTLFSVENDLDKETANLAENSVCRPLAKALKLGVHKRFNDYFESEEWIVAAVATPCFKLKCFRGAAKKEQARQLLLKKVREVDFEQPHEDAPDTQSQQSSNGKGPLLSRWLDSDDEDMPEENSDYCEKQVKNYLAVTGPNRKKLSQLHNFPEIKKVYKKYNVGTPSSAAVERFFSTCGKVYRNERTRLTNANFESHAMLKSNKDKLDKLQNKNV